MLYLNKETEYHFCTIINGGYIAYAKALYDSLAEQRTNALLHVLVLDTITTVEEVENIIFYTSNDLSILPIFKELKAKYTNDELRWSAKPVFLLFLLMRGIKKVIYVDSDIHFFNDFHFLFELLATQSVILSPHNRSINPEADAENFIKNFTEGIYNGGFIGVNNTAVDALEWWASACRYECKKNFNSGLYVDQKYLELIPARFKDVYSLQHLGCNVAGWNRQDCKRVLANGEILINGVEPIVFIHFAIGTNILIVYGDDELLKPHFATYAKRVLLYDEKEDLFQKVHLAFLQSLPKVKTSTLRRVGSLVKRYLKGIKKS